VSSGAGSLSGSRVVMLTDEESASASEILAGAMQDWDRGVIMGRRTFGKGLVQNGFYLTDGSMIRLTIARYYTPSGRSIQSSYSDGYESYMKNFAKRYSDGELMTADSIHFPDSLKYRTLVNKRIVYGGGGIMPDVFIGADTSYYSDYFRRLSGKNVLNTFILDYYDRNRAKINTRYKSFEQFNKEFSFTPEEIKAFIAKGEAEGVKYNEAQYKRSEEEMLLVLKGLLATNMWATSEYFQIINENDIVIRKALQVLSDKKRYDEILGPR